MEQGKSYEHDTEIILDALGNYLIEPPVIRAENREDRRGEFPVTARCPESLSYATIYYDAETYEDLRKDYCDDEFTPELLQTLYVEAGIARASMHDILELGADFHEVSDIDRISSVLDLLKDSDGLARAILEAAEEFTLDGSDQRTLLLAAHEDWLSKPEMLNGLRFQLGVVFLLHGEAGDQMRSAMQRTMIRHLGETLAHEETNREDWERYEKYLETRRVLGQRMEERKSREEYSPQMAEWLRLVNDDDEVADSSLDPMEPEKIKRLFVNAIPQIEIAGSFPMPPQEVVTIARRIVGNGPPRRRLSLVPDHDV